LLIWGGGVGGGVWGSGDGGWAPNPQPPIPNPQSPIPIEKRNFFLNNSNDKIKKLIF